MLQKSMNILLLLFFLSFSPLVFCAFDITISTGPTANIDTAGPWTPTGTPAVINIVELRDALVNDDVTINNTDTTGTEPGDIIIANDIDITTASQGALHLVAGRNIDFTTSFTLGSSSLILTLDAPNANLTFGADTLLSTTTGNLFITCTCVSGLTLGGNISVTDFSLTTEGDIFKAFGIPLTVAGNTVVDSPTGNVNLFGFTTGRISLNASSAIIAVSAFFQLGDIETSGDFRVSATGSVETNGGMSCGLANIAVNGDITISHVATYQFGPLALTATNVNAPAAITSSSLNISTTGNAVMNNANNDISGVMRLNGPTFNLANGVATPASPAIQFRNNTLISLTLTFPNAPSVEVSDLEISTTALIDSSSTDLVLGALSGAGSLTFQGSATRTLSAAANTFAGSIDVDDGTLLVTGALPDATINLGSGTTLGGSGTVGDVSAVDATISPGMSPGTLTAGDVTLSSTALSIEINGAAPGTGYDVFNVQSLSLSDNSSLSVTIGSGFTPTGTLSIVSAASPINGTFQGLPEGPISGGLGGEADVSISYGNAITLIFPEPTAPTSDGTNTGTTGTTGTTDGGDGDGTTGGDGGDGDGDGDGLDTVYIVVIAVVGAIVLIVVVALLVAGIVVLVIFIIKRKPGGKATGDTWWEEDDQDL